MPLSEQDFKAIEDRVIASAPAGLTPEQFDALMDAEAAKGVAGPSAPLVSNIGARPAGGYAMSDTPESGTMTGLRGQLRSVAHPTEARDLLPLAMPSAIGLGAAGVRAAVQSPRVRDAATTGRLAMTGAVAGAAKNLPVVSPMMRGAAQGARQAIDARALGKTMEAVAAPSNVAAARQAVFTSAQRSNAALGAEDVADVVAQLRRPDAVESVGGTIGKLAGRKGATVFEPEVRGGFQVTQPDKWGAQMMRPAKPNISAAQVVRMRVLMSQGLPESEAMRLVTGR